jgi:Ca2+-binding RTX toxin-like protein
MTGANRDGETTTASFDNVSVTAPGHPFSSGSYDYTVSDGPTSDVGHVTITGQDGDTITGTAANEILIGKDGHLQVNAEVQPGDTHDANANNSFSFDFTSGNAGVSITEIKIDASGIGIFDQSGFFGRAFDLGSNSDVTPDSVTSGNTSTLTLTFAPGAFIAGEKLLFRIDTDDTDGFGGHSLDNGQDFGNEGVPFTITFSDGTVLNGAYAPGGGNSSVASLSAGHGSTLLGEGGDDYLIGGNGNDTLVGGAGNDIVSGGAGADHFRYEALSEGGDHILDFNVAEDTIDVLVSGFAGLNPADVGKTADQVTGLFDSDTSGTEATTTNARFHFDAANHTLYYDSDGSGGAASVALATFDDAATVQAHNVHLV